MAQVFKPSSNTYFRVVLASVGLLGGLAFAGLYGFNSASIVTRNYEAHEQPVQFSHKHHNGELGIDCRYCHLSVENSAFAGIPPTQVCMNCHAQIWKDAPILEPVRASFRTGESLEWTRLHDLPDYAYFNHAAHISKGVGCASCHGDVTEMNLTYSVAPLTMGWCLDCHRNPSKNLRPREEVFNMAYDFPDDQERVGRELAQRYQIRSPQALMDCWTCHR